MSELLTMSAASLGERQKQEEVQIIDVRTPVEFRQVHAVGAKNVPLDQLDADAAANSADSSKPIYVICRSGNRSAKACQKLVSTGCDHVVNVDGGMIAWEQAGLPVVRGRKAVSLERQVRIVAGFLVLLGVMLGFLHPAFYLLSAFVGAGLMFAGITDTCGMAMLLAKMPWNKVREQACSP